MNQHVSGHLFASICVIFWGISFIASKNLMAFLSPLQLMWMRFIIAYIFLWIIQPRWHFLGKEELLLAVASLFCNTLYFLTENSALLYTQASNVSICVTMAPVFTAIIMFIIGGEKVSGHCIIGYIIAFCGVLLVVGNGVINLEISPKGDILAILAALCWAIYMVMIEKPASRHSTFLISRKLMFYGIITATPFVLYYCGDLIPGELLELNNIVQLLFLGCLCSGFSYVMWNQAVKNIGVYATNFYIYVIPVVALIAGAILLNEIITPMGLSGTALVIGGMIYGTLRKKKTSEE